MAIAKNAIRKMRELVEIFILMRIWPIFVEFDEECVSISMSEMCKHDGGTNPLRCHGAIDSVVLDRTMSWQRDENMSLDD